MGTCCGSPTECNKNLLAEANCEVANLEKAQYDIQLTKTNNGEMSWPAVKEIISASGDRSLISWNKDFENNFTHDSSGKYYRLVDLKKGRFGASKFGGEIEIFNLRKNEIELTLKGHRNNYIYAMCYLESGELITGGWDKEIRIWDVGNGACLHILEEHSNPILSLLLHGNGKLISGDNRGIAKVWSLATKKCLGDLEHGSAVWIYDLVQLHDDSEEASVISICASSLIALKVWNIITLTTTHNFAPPAKEQRGFRSGLILPNTNKLLLGGMNGNIMVLNTKNWMFELNIHVHDDRVTQIWMIDQFHMISSSIDHSIKVTNLRNSKIIQILEDHKDAVFSILPIFE